MFAEDLHFSESLNGLCEEIHTFDFFIISFVNMSFLVNYDKTIITLTYNKKLAFNITVYFYITNINIIRVILWQGHLILVIGCHIIGCGFAEPASV